MVLRTHFLRSETSMKLLLHIGFHKTGTSAFQAYCAASRSALAHQGVLYPRTGVGELKIRSSDTSIAGHRRFETLLKSPKGKAAEELLVDLVAEAQAAQSETVILSSETFSKPDLRLARNLPEVLARHFEEVNVLAYLRQQGAWAHSFYREFICWPRQAETRTFNDFCEQYLAPWLDYERRLDVWADIFGHDAMVVRSYDDRKHRNIVADIFDLLGVEIKKLDDVGDFNVSLPSHLVPMMRQINAASLAGEFKSEMTREIYRLLAQSTETSQSIELPCPFLEHQATAYHVSNTRVAQRYGLGDAAKFLTLHSSSTFAPSPEPTLQASDRESILKSVKSHHRAARKIRPNNGKWGVSIFANKALAQSASCIDYHLALGASHIVVYLDDSDDPVQTELIDHRVTFVPCDRDFWRVHLNRPPRNNAEKLQICHGLGLASLRKRHGLAWAINLDTDELLWVDPRTTVQAVLSELSRDCNQVIVPPREALYTNDAEQRLFAARYFKVRRHDPEANYLNINNGNWLEKAVLRFFRVWGRHWTLDGCRVKRIFENTLLNYGYKNLERLSRLGHFGTRIWSGKDQKLYARALPMAAKVSRCGFLGHRGGRVATSRGVVLDVMDAHRPKSTFSRTRVRETSGRLFCLHYHGADYETWYQKWCRRAFENATVENKHERRRNQQELFKSAHENQTTERLFRDLFVLPERHVETFLKQGLAVQMEIPFIDEITRKWLAHAGAAGTDLPKAHTIPIEVPERLD